MNQIEKILKTMVAMFLASYKNLGLNLANAKKGAVTLNSALELGLGLTVLFFMFAYFIVSYYNTTVATVPTGITSSQWQGLWLLVLFIVVILFVYGVAKGRHKG